jgi:hypothetical protein
MGVLLEKITEWLKEALVGGITANFTGMFDELNTKVGQIAAEVGTPPGSWNPGVFDLIKSLSETVITPIAGMILTAIVCYELIHLIIERNNLHDFETFVFFKWIFKTGIAVYLLTHTFDITMGIFDIAQHVIGKSADLIDDSLDVNLVMANLATELNAMEWYELLGLYIESAILSLGMKAISICVFLIVYGRMIEIYLTTSVAPIPIATMANREWGGIGTNYLKTLFAVAFQGFLIMVCVAIYAKLLEEIPSAGNIHASIWATLGYTILLCFSLFRTSNLSRSLFGAH